MAGVARLPLHVRPHLLPLTEDIAMPGPLVDSTALLEDPEALAARGNEDGYLFFRGLLPPE